MVDDANLPSTRQIVSDYASTDQRFRYLATPTNLGLPGARNFGLQHSRGQYIRHLDADDFLAANALELEAGALDKDWGIHIAYGHLEVVNPDGTRRVQGGEPVRGGWPEDEFKWHYQMAHLNQLPSCSMARREVYEKTGGYRERMTRQEDAEFWCRATSFGFRAKKITQAVTYFHRERGDSKGAREWNEKGSEPDWTAWFPWRWGGHDFRSGLDVLRTRGDRPRNAHLVPFGAQGPPPQGLRFWYVHDFAYPVVSIVVTCGPGHQKYLIDALDSIQAQTYPDWECVVVNDTGEAWESDLLGAPWAKVVNMGGNYGASAARNEGFRHTRAKYIVFMDADDYWLPWFLERMVLFAEKNDGVIYSDIFVEEHKGIRLSQYPYDFHSELVISDYQYSGTSVLLPRTIVQAVVGLQGGWDTDIPGQEDADYQVATHHLGFCAFHIHEPLFVYRTTTTTKREKDYARIAETNAYMRKKWAVYMNGDKYIMCGCAPPKIPSGEMPESLLTSSGNFQRESVVMMTHKESKEQMVMMEYIGPRAEAFTINSRVDPNNTRYRFGNNEHHRFRAVLVGDVEYLLGKNVAGEREYRLVKNTAVPDTHDPAVFLGRPLTA